MREHTHRYAARRLVWREVTNGEDESEGGGTLGDVVEACEGGVVGGGAARQEKFAGKEAVHG